MLIDGQKWACEACIRGHRVSSCKHHGMSEIGVLATPSNNNDPEDVCCVQCGPVSGVQILLGGCSTCGLCGVTLAIVPQSVRLLERSSLDTSQSSEISLCFPIFTTILITSSSCCILLQLVSLSNHSPPDRPLIRIKRKGRPFATCAICHATPCEAPSEHARLKREAELKSPSSSSSKKASHGRLYPRHPSSNGFLPIAPRPSGKCRSANKEAGPSSVSGAEVSPSSAAVSRSGSVSAASVSSSCLTPPIRGSKASSSRRPKTRGSSVGEWSGSEGSGAGSGTESYGESLVHLLPSTSSSMAGASVPLPVSPPEMTSRAGSSEAMARPPAAASSSSLEPTTLDHTTMCETIFDPMYSLDATTSAAAVSAGLVATMPMLSPMEGANPFDFPLDPSLRLDEQTLGYLDDLNLDVDLSEGLADEVFAVEDWSRYMWSPENGFEHLDTDYPPVSQ
ncbi:hypothetical protein N7539_002094 [Penicillium diatomitis]|uniref:Copper-fist domain-containing protein n=1 Tax=Penicillium diatomitis TaxID=2819901 RepID=A0A9W9XI84_9EURO|nr:uncharacterized protein N7539_002094 [Penicillium diatomitis]KAJ5493348.1 hypothetical protein N7539_002094 [Penicillium diatomitis]